MAIAGDVVAVAVSGAGPVDGLPLETGPVGVLPPGRDRQRAHPGEQAEEQAGGERMLRQHLR